MSNKKKFGQFYTNPIVADFMTKLAVSDSTIDFLDPTVGPGIFVEYAHKINAKMNIDVFEIDSEMVDTFKKNIDFKTNINNIDFLYSDDKKYDSIVCNPPYNKFQEIPNRKSLIASFKNRYNIKLSGYTNYCIYFLIKCLNQLKENGKCIFIIPYEFMNAGYGERIKEYILSSKKMKMMIKFQNNIKLFDNAITTSCILFFENNIHESIDFIEVNNLEELNKIINQEYFSLTYFKYSYKDLDSKEKWSQYYNKKEPKYKNLVRFNTVAQVKRGIATGNNKFFTLSKEDIKKHSLSPEVCVPCVIKSLDIEELIMDENYFQHLFKLNKKIFVFDGREKTTINDEKYIAYGEKIGVNKTYLNSHRSPWYGIEDRDPAPIWISVFSRDKLKVIRNEILIKNLTAFHGIYINDDYLKYTNILFCYFQTPIAQKILRMNKREYGKGLDKFEPNDINNSDILNLTIINDNDIITIQNIYDNYKKEKYLDIDLLNSIFSKYLI